MRKKGRKREKGKGGGEKEEREKGDMEKKKNGEGKEGKIVEGEEKNLKWKGKVWKWAQPFFVFLFLLVTFWNHWNLFGCTKMEILGGNFLTSPTFECTPGYAPAFNPGLVWNIVKWRGITPLPKSSQKVCDHSKVKWYLKHSVPVTLLLTIRDRPNTYLNIKTDRTKPLTIWSGVLVQLLSNNPTNAYHNTVLHVHGYHNMIYWVKKSCNVSKEALLAVILKGKLFLLAMCCNSIETHVKTMSFSRYSYRLVPRRS